MKTVYLFPYGGGSAASYRSYANRFPCTAGRVVPVEIPGRGKRADEPYARSIQECARRALQEVNTDSDDYILHGHCMGALLAFEAIKLLEQEGRQLPDFMVVSGRNAPRHVNEWLRRVPALDDRSLFKEMQELGGVPRRLSFAMAQNFLTVLRHDQAMIQEYEPGATPISAPILVLAGKDDSMTHAAALLDWESYTSQFISMEWLQGQHYSFLDQPDQVAAYIDAFSNLVESRGARQRPATPAGFSH
jgi:surfactin synthase thioesterase subunit